MREEKALAERKRQLDKTLATAPADNQKGRKKPRIVKLARQPAIEHPAARPNFVHSPHREYLCVLLYIFNGYWLKFNRSTKTVINYNFSGKPKWSNIYT